MTCIGVEKQLRLWRFLRDCEAVLGRDHDIGNAVSHQDRHAELGKMRPCSSIALPPRRDRLALSATGFRRNGRALPEANAIEMPSGGDGPSLGFREEQELDILTSRHCLCCDFRDAWMRWRAVGATGTRACDHKMAYTLRPGQRDRLPDITSK